MTRHHRPADVIDRMAKSIRAQSVHDFDGRLPTMPKTVTGGVGAPREIEGNENQVRIEHIGLRGVVGQQIAAGGGRIAFDVVDGAPTEVRGFDTARGHLAADGSVTDVTVDITGVLTITLDGEWESYTGCDTITIIRTRGGVEETKVFALGPVQSEVFD